MRTDFHEMESSGKHGHPFNAIENLVSGMRAAFSLFPHLDNVIVMEVSFSGLSSSQDDVDSSRDFLHFFQRCNQEMKRDRAIQLATAAYYLELDHPNYDWWALACRLGPFLGVWMVR